MHELSESEMISYTMQAIYDTFHLLKMYLYIYSIFAMSLGKSKFQNRLLFIQQNNVACV